MNEQIRSFLRLLDERAPGEAAHAQRVAVFAVATGHEMGLNDEELQVLHAAASLHDIGKLTLDKEILSKHDPLSEGELVGIRDHVKAAEWLLEGIEWAKPCLAAIRHHHERWDGDGYPDALFRDQIPLHARIIAAAELFDAVSYDQSYRAGVGEEKGLESVQAASGKRLDPEVAQAFLRVQPLIQPLT
jgi:HD-GYP domain-containing protein (c-di-GMP phosphodiesterase class II)